MWCWAWSRLGRFAGVEVNASHSSMIQAIWVGIEWLESNAQRTGALALVYKVQRGRQASRLLVDLKDDSVPAHRGGSLLHG